MNFRWRIRIIHNSSWYAPLLKLTNPELLVPSAFRVEDVSSKTEKIDRVKSWQWGGMGRVDWTSKETSAAAVDNSCLDEGSGWRVPFYRGAIACCAIMIGTQYLPTLSRLYVVYFYCVSNILNNPNMFCSFSPLAIVRPPVSPTSGPLFCSCGFWNCLS